MLKVVLGVAGSIAAYKCLTLVRLMVKAGHQVRVIMTPAATAFVSPLSFATLSKHEVYVDLIDNHTWSNHVELGLWADLMLIAPATATTIAKLARGISDNMLVATYLSAKCPVYIAPAMDLDMWKHPATIGNIDLLKSYGNHIIPVGHGELASGLVGDGRMAEPEEIITLLDEYHLPAKDLAGRHVLITAGPTQEAIDPVRFISNRSTGMMGIRLAQSCSRRGARVSLVMGPNNLHIELPEVEIHYVRSAAEMYHACSSLYASCDVAIFAAAVADYTPLHTASQKLKKSDSDLNIPLKRTVDIAKTLGALKRSDQINVGFALETEEGIEYARSKLDKKNFDFIVLNSLKDKGAGFGVSTNKITIISKDAEDQTFPVKNKAAVAHDIINKVVAAIANKKEEI